MEMIPCGPREYSKIWDLCEIVAELLWDGKTKGEIAREMGLSEHFIVQLNNIAVFPAYLRDEIQKEIDKGRINIVKSREIAEAAFKAIEEFKRRLNLPRRDPVSISMSIAWMYSASVVCRTDRLTLPQAIELLFDLTGVDQELALDPLAASADFRTFVDKAMDYTKENRKEQE